jgi:pyruvate/2-oxoglutarate dehydrogenase complex dihydrolipoamide dehydrogenase (E3) component
MAEAMIHRGKRVDLIEMKEHVLPQMDPDMVKTIEDSLCRAGVNLLLNQEVVRVENVDSKLKLHLKSGLICSIQFLASHFSLFF